MTHWRSQLAPMGGWVAFSLRGRWPTAGQPHRYHLSYFGENQPGEAMVAVPPGEHYSATLIDTWEMTETKLSENVQRGDVLNFAPKPYQALLFRRVD